MRRYSSGGTVLLCRGEVVRICEDPLLGRVLMILISSCWDYQHCVAQDRFLRVLYAARICYSYAVLCSLSQYMHCYVAYTVIDLFHESSHNSTLSSVFSTWEHLKINCENNHKKVYGKYELRWLWIREMPPVFQFKLGFLPVSCFLPQLTTISICKTTILPLVLYGCETWSVPLREERRMQVLETSVLGIRPGRKAKEVTVGCRRLAKEVTVGWRRLAKDVTVGWRRLAKEMTVGSKRLAKDATVGWRRLAKEVTVGWRRLYSDELRDVYTSHTYWRYSLPTLLDPAVTSFALSPNVEKINMTTAGCLLRKSCEKDKQFCSSSPQRREPRIIHA